MDKLTERQKLRFIKGAIGNIYKRLIINKPIEDLDLWWDTFKKWHANREAQESGIRDVN